LRQWIFAQWRVMDSAGRLRIASALLASFAVRVVPGADPQDPARDGFHLRVRCVGKAPGAVASADADNEEREDTKGRAGQEHGWVRLFWGDAL
jgi:hypothetical protein